MTYVIKLLIIFCLLYGCNADQNNKRYDSTSSFLESWNSHTINSLKKLQEVDKKNRYKIDIIIHSVQSDSSDIDYLDRKNFVVQENSRLDTLLSSKLLILELRESGEVISNRKYILDESLNRAYIFSRDNRGDWTVSENEKISDDRLKQVKELLFERPNKDSSMWGYDINDCLIITELINDSLSIKPLSTYSSSNLIELKKLFRVNKGN